MGRPRTVRPQLRRDSLGSGIMPEAEARASAWHNARLEQLAAEAAARLWRAPRVVISDCRLPDLRLRQTAALACGRVLRPGRTLTVGQADVFTNDQTERTLIATMRSTIIVRATGSTPSGAA